MNRLEEKVAIITGAGGGMGREEAILFAKEGATVVVTDIQEDKVNEVVAEIIANGGQAVGQLHDVTDEAAWARIAQETIDAYGKIDILVNNAGISINQKLHETSVEQWDKVLDINLTGTFLGMKHVIPNMMKNNQGSIINISSISGLTGGGGDRKSTRLNSSHVAISYAVF